LLLGAYLLGGLSAAEHAAVREHLDRCALCRAEHDELACVPGWLDLLAESEAERPGTRRRPRRRGLRGRVVGLPLLGGATTAPSFTARLDTVLY
jgi:anti-sigma factor RsiW